MCAIAIFGSIEGTGEGPSLEVINALDEHDESIKHEIINRSTRQTHLRLIGSRRSV